WNLTWDAWQRGSATGTHREADTPAATPHATPARLQPEA
ncbi:MAG: hypothetical protein QOF84_2552, partial [Streptomyces sp.]|nr:hypothetical protein [Streptomyces sp.]